jgi:hypothetical protein
MFPRDSLPPLLEEALRSPQPRAALQRLTSRLLEMGAERDDLLPALEALLGRLDAAGQPEQADLLRELLDGFGGWCRLP